jgi:hypothetical protein
LREEEHSGGESGRGTRGEQRGHGVHPVDEVLPPGRLAVFGFQHVLALLRLPVGDADRAEQQHHRGQPGGDYPERGL